MKPKDPNSISFARRILGPVAIAVLGTLSLGGCSGETEAHADVDAVTTVFTTHFYVDAVEDYSGQLSNPPGYLPNTVTQEVSEENRKFDTCDPTTDFWGKYQGDNVRKDASVDAKERGFLGQDITVLKTNSFIRSSTHSKYDYEKKDWVDVEDWDTCYTVNYTEEVIRFSGKRVSGQFIVHSCYVDSGWKSESNFRALPDDSTCKAEGLAKQSNYAKTLPEGAGVYAPTTEISNWILLSLMGEGNSKDVSTSVAKVDSNQFDEIVEDYENGERKYWIKGKQGVVVVLNRNGEVVRVIIENEAAK
jgi:hypothetical protein